MEDEVGNLADLT